MMADVADPFPERRTNKAGMECRQVVLPGYFVEYIHGGANAHKLVITFESGGSPEQARMNGLRDPWGARG